MQYLDGEEVKLGDHVTLGGGMTGRVVCLLDQGAHEPGFERLMSDGPSRGIFVQSPEAGLVHFEFADNDLTLVSRGN